MLKVYNLRERVRMQDSERGIDISYAKKKYGPLIDTMIKLSMETEKRYNNFIVKYEDHAKMYLYTPKFGVKVTLIDLDDVERVSNFYWGMKDAEDKIVYVNASHAGKQFRLHRFIMGVNDPDIKIDHKNQNSLDNRKCNLRKVTDAYNSRNTGMNKSNTSGYKGIQITQNDVRAAIGYEYKTLSKSFSIKKYGYEEALRMALEWRKKKEKELGFYDTSVRLLFKNKRNK